MPLGKNVKQNMKELTDKHPDWQYKRRLAASLNAARQHGSSSVPRARKARKSIRKHKRS